MKILVRTSISIICLSFIWSILSIPSTAFAEKPIHVAVSILPQKYFVKKIGGDRVHVSAMVLPGANPATYEPKPRQMVNLAKSKIYFATGVPFEENWLPKFSKANPKMKIVHTQTGITKIPMKAGRHRHHGAEHGHEVISTEAKDPHIWLSPPLVMVQAKNILDGLIKADPANRKLYETNYKAFIEELKDLDLKLKTVFQTTGINARFMVYHPSWGYFANTYGLEQIPIELEGKKPSPRQLLELIKEARKDGIKVIFVQPQFSEKSAETIASAIGGKVVFTDPLAEDWKNNLYQVAEKFKSAFTTGP
ncbi:MAG: cation ABC transporter substrate-binding protein [Desulfobacteraceae bacterium 4572_87]|nr:MAG: cation ABC transporter substrate-binding protein [Desulfobacteraceae bacterium 4572_87]